MLHIFCAFCALICAFCVPFPFRWQSRASEILLRPEFHLEYKDRVHLLNDAPPAFFITVIDISPI